MTPAGRIRECRGCYGTGYVTGHGNACGMCGDEAPCLACLGTGRVGDRIPARDAECDAETLRLFSDTGYSRACAWAPEDRTLYWTRAASEWARMALGGARDFANERGIEAARAAFRAVPGLRDAAQGKED